MFLRYVVVQKDKNYDLEVLTNISLKIGTVRGNCSCRTVDRYNLKGTVGACLVTMFLKTMILRYYTLQLS
jgi:hypothetical protein